MALKNAADEDLELSFNSHVRDIQQDTDKTGASSIVQQDEREMRRMGKVPLYKACDIIMILLLFLRVTDVL